MTLRGNIHAGSRIFADLRWYVSDTERSHARRAGMRGLRRNSRHKAARSEIFERGHFHGYPYPKGQATPFANRDRGAFAGVHRFWGKFWSGVTMTSIGGQSRQVLAFNGNVNEFYKKGCQEKSSPSAGGREDFVSRSSPLHCKSASRFAREVLLLSCLPFL